MPRKKKYQPCELINYIGEYVLSLKQAQIINATGVAQWLTQTKKINIRYQAFTRCPEAKQYIEDYNQNVREASSKDAGRNTVTYVTMDIDAEASKMENLNDRKKRLVEIDNQLEQMVFTYNRLHKEKKELELKLASEKAVRETQAQDIARLQEEKTELIQRLSEAETKIKKAKCVERKYITYIRKYLYEPIMRAQLIQAGLVKIDGTQVLPEEFKVLMDGSSNIEKTIHDFIHFFSTTDETMSFEEPQLPDVENVQTNNKVLSFTDRLLNRLKDLED